MRVRTTIAKRWLAGLTLLMSAALLTGHSALAQSSPQSAQKAGSKSAASGKSQAGKPQAGKKRKAVAKPARSQRPVRAARPSYGQLFGLHATDDALDLRSSVALVVDQETDEVLFSKNPNAVLPIASITKLMTALVVTEAQLPLDEVLEVSAADVAATAGSPSRLKPGTQFTRGEMLHLALMASENRAAHVLGRTYPGGMSSFVQAMNGKAQLLGMQDTRYVEPTGLSPNNQSSASDLTRLVRAAFEHPILRDLSTSLEAAMPVGRRTVQFRNTNGLVRNPEWEIGLQKTGYISAAGRCVVLQTQMAGRKLIMVLLDSAGKYSRIGDAERLRSWLKGSGLLPAGQAGAAAASELGAAPLAATALQPR